MSRAEKVRAMVEALGKYEVLTENHEGMNSYSFVARHRPLDSPAFLKVYDVEPEGMDLYKEGRLLKAMSDASATRGHLVRVLDAERLDHETVMLAMEYVDGGSLLTQLQKRTRFPLMDGIRIAVGILHGLGQLHARSLVHRDLKPANILLDSSDLWPKIGDFGSVSELDVAGFAIRKSRRSALYIPPEGWGENPKHSRESDLYQVGIVAHELINGALPTAFCDHLDAEASRDLRKLGAKSISDVPDPVERSAIVNRAIARRAGKRRLLELSPCQPYVPDSVRRALRRATAPDATSRFHSASEFIADLERLSLPNWKVEGDAFEAFGWKGAEWRVCVEQESFVAYRRLSADYRHWETASSLSVLFDAIAEYSA